MVVYRLRWQRRMIVPHNIELHRTSILLPLVDTVLHAMHAPHTHTCNFQCEIWLCSFRFFGSGEKQFSVYFMLRNRSKCQSDIDIYTRAEHIFHVALSSLNVVRILHTNERPRPRYAIRISLSPREWMVEYSAHRHSNARILTIWIQYGRDERFTALFWFFWKLHGTKKQKKKWNALFFVCISYWTCALVHQIVSFVFIRKP